MVRLREAFEVTKVWNFEGYIDKIKPNIGVKVIKDFEPNCSVPKNHLSWNLKTKWDWKLFIRRL